MVWPVAGKLVMAEHLSVSIAAVFVGLLLSAHWICQSVFTTESISLNRSIEFVELFCQDSANA